MDVWYGMVVLYKEIVGLCISWKLPVGWIPGIEAYRGSACLWDAVSVHMDGQGMEELHMEQSSVGS